MTQISLPALTGVLLITASLLSSVHLSAETIVQYSFGTNTSATTANANLTASSVTAGSGIAGINAGRSGSSNSLFARASETHGSNQLSIGNAIADNDYFVFTVDVGEGFEMDLASFQFDLGYTRNGGFEGKQFKGYLLTSIDGFVDATSIVGSQTINLTSNQSTATYPNGTTTITLGGLSQFQDLTSAVEFRIYIADNTGSTDYIHRIDNVTLDGAVTAVPESGTYALLGGSLALGYVMLHRRKQS